MADQYVPRTTTTTIEGANPYSTNIRTETTPPVVVRDSSGGFGTGMLVALVFVVVAVIAAVVFNNRDTIAPEAASPAVTIENNAAPAAVTPAPEVVAPAPEAAAPADAPPAPAPAAPSNP